MGMKATIREDLKQSMKNRDKETTSTLRMLLAAIQEEETSGKAHEASDQDILRVIAREIKKRHEFADVYAKAGRDELADSERAEIAVLERYQPKQLSDEELNALVDRVIKQHEADGGEVSMKAMGQIMKAATAEAKGTADGKRLSTAVRARLQG